MAIAFILLSCGFCLAVTWASYVKTNWEDDDKE